MSEELTDLDSILGLLMHDLGRYHNQGSHSLVSGLVVAALLAGILYAFQRRGIKTWMVIFLAAYESHVLLDAFTLGRGVMLFWPFSSARFSPPFYLFYGLRWSDGLFSINHLWTFLTEAGLIAGVYCLFRGYQFIKKKFEAGTPSIISESNHYS